MKRRDRLIIKLIKVHIEGGIAKGFSVSENMQMGTNLNKNVGRGLNLCSGETVEVYL